MQHPHRQKHYLHCSVQIDKVTVYTAASTQMVSTLQHLRWQNSVYCAASMLMRTACFSSVDADCTVSTLTLYKRFRWELFKSWFRQRQIWKFCLLAEKTQGSELRDLSYQAAERKSCGSVWFPSCDSHRVVAEKEILSPKNSTWLAAQRWTASSRVFRPNKLISHAAWRIICLSWLPSRGVAAVWTVLGARPPGASCRPSGKQVLCFSQNR